MGLEAVNLEARLPNESSKMWCNFFCTQTHTQNTPANCWRGCFCIAIYALLTLTAFGPFGLSATSKVTLSPSRSSLNVTSTSSFEWKKRSFSCPSHLMNPKPLSVSRAIVPSDIVDMYEERIKNQTVCRRSRLDLFSTGSALN